MKNIKIGIVGLGYVGIPLAIEFGKKFPTIGFDINPDRVNELNNGIDRTKEVSKKDISRARQLTFTYDNNLLKDCNLLTDEQMNRNLSICYFGNILTE